MKLVYATRDAGEDRAGGAHCCRRGIRLASLEWVRPCCMDPRSVDPSVLTFFLLSCIAIVTALNPKRRSILQPFALRRSLFPLPPRKNQKINFSVPKSLRESRFRNRGPTRAAAGANPPSSKSGKRGAAPREETDKTVTMASVARSLRKFLGEIQHVKVRPRDRAHEGAPWRGRTSRNSPRSEDSTITYLPRQEGAVACREGHSFSCGWLRLVPILIGVIVPPLPPAAVVPSPAHFV